MQEITTCSQAPSQHLHSCLRFTSREAPLVPSVHGYGDFIGGAAILLVAVVPVLLSCMAIRRRKDPQVQVERESFSAALAFWSLTLIASLDLILLLYQSLGPFVGVVFSPSRQLYNFTSFPMLVLFLGVLFVKCIKEHPTYRDMIVSFAFSRRWDSCFPC